MRLSTKTRYGVRAVFDIAYHGRDRCTASQAKDIARRADIPVRYLEQIIQDLKRAGLVESRRGPRGGYTLRRPPAEISLGDVVRALQGPLEELFLVEDDPATPPAAVSVSTVTGAMWREFAEHMSRWFESMTIADLVERGRELGLPQVHESQPMYYI